MYTLFCFPPSPPPLLSSLHYHFVTTLVCTYFSVFYFPFFSSFAITSLSFCSLCFVVLFPFTFCCLICIFPIPHTAHYPCTVHLFFYHSFRLFHMLSSNLILHFYAPAPFLPPFLFFFPFFTIHPSSIAF